MPQVCRRIRAQTDIFTFQWLITQQQAETPHTRQRVPKLRKTADAEIRCRDINLLTLIVSLEAIYITLFIGLGQKLADKRAVVHAQAEKAEATKAESHREQLSESQSKLLGVNTDMTEQVAKLTREIHDHMGIKSA